MDVRLDWRPVFLVLALVAPGAAGAGTFDEARRKTTRQQLSVEVERLELPNGLVVLLAPDQGVSSVAVWMTFQAGAIHEPPGRGGMAHLVEHVMASGPTPETDYAAILEGRRARYFNASTGLDHMSFEAVVPAEELPAALWVAADRLGRLPALIDAPLVEHHRRIVVQERALRVVDAPYGLVEEQFFGRLYPAPHPLHAGVAGAPGELARVGADEVRAFVAELLVPANAVLVVVGKFDPRAARRLVEEGLGRLPGGRRARPPVLPPPGGEFVDKREAPLSREPRVTMAWRLPGLPHDDAVALGLGAQLLSLLTDGAFGMRLSAGLAEYAGEAAFMLELTVPHGEAMPVIHRDAEGFLRFLTVREMPVEHILAANLLLDRLALLDLEALEGRAEALTWFERFGGGRLALGDHLGFHWKLDRVAIRDVARTHLRGPNVVMHARPTHPRAARLERE
jgi:zinc protease